MQIHIPVLSVPSWAWCHICITQLWPCCNLWCPLWSFFVTRGYWEGCWVFLVVMQLLQLCGPFKPFSRVMASFLGHHRWIAGSWAPRQCFGWNTAVAAEHRLPHLVQGLEEMCLCTKVLLVRILLSSFLAFCWCISNPFSSFLGPWEEISGFEPVEVTVSEAVRISDVKRCP